MASFGRGETATAMSMSAEQIRSRAVVILGASVFLSGGIACQADRIVSVPGFVRYERDDVEHLFERSGGSRPWEVFEMRRDSSGSRLYLYGWSEVATVDESGKLMPVSKALPSENSLGFELHRTVGIAPFGWPSIAVVDMDLAGKRVVVEKNYDTSQPWFLFDFGTGVLTKIGQKSAYGFFLRGDLLRKQPLSRTRPAPGE